MRLFDGSGKARSSLPSPLKSPAARAPTKVAGVEKELTPKVPSPFPKKTAIAFPIEATTSACPSELKSPVTVEKMTAGVKMRDSNGRAMGVASVISKSAMFEIPPPGVGFTTVTAAVPADTRSAAGTWAISF